MTLICAPDGRDYADWKRSDEIIRIVMDMDGAHDVAET